jgi:hypothetical protein
VNGLSAQHCEGLRDPEILSLYLPLCFKDSDPLLPEKAAAHH